MHSFPNWTRVVCVDAQRSRSAPQALGYRAHDGCRCSLMYSIYTNKPLEGRGRFESIFRIDSLSHARLSWRAYLLILYFTGDLPELPSGWAGANGYQRKYINTTVKGLGAGAAAGAGTHLLGGSRK
eukprot:3064975-Pleurochrysis_carterae.AAC.2